MPQLSDEMGATLNRALGHLVHEITREMMRRLALQHEISKALKELGKITGEEYVAVAFRTSAGAKSVLDSLRSEKKADFNIIQRENFLLVPKEKADVVHEVARSKNIDAHTMTDKELEEGKTVFPEKVVEEVARLEEISGERWSSVQVMNPKDMTPDGEVAKACSDKLKEAGVDCVAVEGCVLFPEGKKDDLIKAAEGIVGGPATIRMLSDIDREMSRGATRRQAKLIDDLHRKGVISDKEIEDFKANPTMQAARDLLNRHGDEAGKLPDVDKAGNVQEQAADKVSEVKDVSRDDAIIEGSFAAQRREDIGNTQTTAEYVQARPNTGDMDKTTPYGDQCDPAGAGDRDGDGIKDAAEDHDLDGISNLDEERAETEPEDVPRDIKDLQEEMTAQAAWLNRHQHDMGRQVSLQQETR